MECFSIIYVWTFFRDVTDIFRYLNGKISHHCCLLRLSRGKGSCLVSWCHSKQTNNNKFDKRARKFKLPPTTKDWWKTESDAEFASKQNINQNWILIKTFFLVKSWYVKDWNLGRSNYSRHIKLIKFFLFQTRFAWLQRFHDFFVRNPKIHIENWHLIVFNLWGKYWW